MPIRVDLPGNRHASQTARWIDLWPLKGQQYHALINELLLSGVPGCTCAKEVDSRPCIKPFGATNKLKKQGFSDKPSYFSDQGAGELPGHPH
jgi:hypothetical protein